MKQRTWRLFLLSACCMVCFSGCRRKITEPETETQIQSETITETQSETITEIQKQPETKKQPETEKKATAQNPKTTAAKPVTQTPATQAPATEAVQTPTTEPPSQQCPYCGYWYYTTSYGDGTSDYSNHVAAEEAQLAASEDYDASQYYTGNDGVEYAQCPYCYQWFSTAQDATGYSPYSDHVAAEAAYAAQQSQEEYYQCPYCGNWVTAYEYQEHIANGW